MQDNHHRQRIWLATTCFLLLIAVFLSSRVFNKSIYNQNNQNNQSQTSQESPAGAVIDRRNPNIEIKPLPAGADTSTTPPATPTAKPRPPAPAPESVISADAYLVGNVETGQIYLSYNPHVRRPIASISKLFTTLVTKANMFPDQVVEITQPMLDVYPDAYGLTLGEKFTTSDLINPLLLQSNNNVAEGFAMTYGYDAFIKKMNDLAATIGLASTHFQDASGLGSGNISDATDLFSFARYLYFSHRDILTLTTVPSVSIASTTDHAAHVFTNIDAFVGDPNFIGGKTGRTDLAGETMLSIFNYKNATSSYPIAIIVLHSDIGTRQIDSEALLIRAITLIDKK